MALQRFSLYHIFTINSFIILDCLCEIYLFTQVSNFHIQRSKNLFMMYNRSLYMYMLWNLTV